MTNQDKHNQDRYQQALDALLISEDFTQRTVDYLQQQADVPAPKPRRITRRRALLSAASLVAVLALVFAVSGLLHQGQDTPLISDSYIEQPFDLAARVDLARSDGVKVRFTDGIPEVQVSSSLVYLTEDEILGISPSLSEDGLLYFLIGQPIVRGEIIALSNFILTMNGHQTYWSLLGLRVDECLRGEIEQGSEISILLPAPIDVEGLWVEDTDTISHCRAGREAIFVLQPYAEDSVRTEGNSTLYLRELADYGLSDGIRFAFIQTGQGIVYGTDAFPSMPEPQSLDDVERFIVDKIANAPEVELPTELPPSPPGTPEDIPQQ